MLPVCVGLAFPEWRGFLRGSVSAVRPGKRGIGREHLFDAWRDPRGRALHPGVLARHGFCGGLRRPLAREGLRVLIPPVPLERTPLHPRRAHDGLRGFGRGGVVSADGFLRLPDDGGAQFRSTFPVVSGAELCVRIPVPESGRLACGFALAAVDAQEGGAASDDYTFDLLVTVRALDASGAVLEQSVQALRCQGYLDTAPLDARFAFSVEPTGLCQLYPLSDSGVTSEWRQVAGVSFRSASFVVAAASNGGLAAGTACPFAIALGTDPGCVSTGQFEFTRTDGRAGPSVPFSVRLVPDQTTVAAAGGLEGDGLPVRTSDIHGDLGAYSCMVGMPTFGGGSRFVVVPAVVGQVLDENGSAFGHWGWSGALEIRLPPEVVEDMSRRRIAAGRYHADIYVCVVSRL